LGGEIERGVKRVVMERKAPGLLIDLKRAGSSHGCVPKKRKRNRGIANDLFNG